MTPFLTRRLLLALAMVPAMPRLSWTTDREQRVHTAGVDGARISLTQPPAWANAFFGEQLTNSNTRLAVIQIDLQAGWKTYWRLPGRFGIAPAFDWSASTNLQAATVTMPAPVLFNESDGQSIGYVGAALWLVEVVPTDPALPVDLHLSLEMGLCDTLCILSYVELSRTYGAMASTHDPSDAISPAQASLLASRLPISATPAPNDLTDENNRFWVLEGAYDQNIHHFGAPISLAALQDRWPHADPPIRLLEIEPGLKLTSYAL